MGMSASQARLLALEARQSNLEYQGQQINQARTVLSQQCTALYNSLLDMKVPTPPSTTDFQTIEYEGTQGASKFSIGNVVPSGDGVYDVDLKFTRNGNCVGISSRPEITVYNEPKMLTGDYVNNDETFNQPATTISYYTAIPDDKTTYEELTFDERDKYSDDTVVMHTVTGNIDDEEDGGTKYEYYYQTDNGKFIKANDFLDAETKGGKGSVFAKITVGDLKNQYGDNEDYWNNTGCFDYVMSSNEEKTETSGGFTLDAVSSQNFYDTSKKPAELITDIKKYLKEVGTGADGKPIYTFENPGSIFKASNNGAQEIENPNYSEEAAKKGVSVDGCSPQTFSKETLGEKYDSIVQSVANSFPEYKKYDENGKVIGYDTDAMFNDFKVIYKDGAPCFVKTTELENQAKMKNNNGQGRVDLYSLEPNGEYTESLKTPGCKLGFDANGRINSIEIPVKDSEGNLTGNYEKIDLTPKTVVDDAAYKDAMAQYEYENYLYDQKNKEINAKTEVIQQEDRNLELKLQRLDNERTQITTEIEAVQKVIKDNIEKSYKTFNG